MRGNARNAFHRAGESVAAATTVARSDAFTPLNLGLGISATPYSTPEDPRIAPFSEIASADDLVNLFQGMTKAQLIVQARMTGANPTTFGTDSMNEQIIALVSDQVVAFREATAAEDTTVATVSETSTPSLGLARPRAEESPSTPDIATRMVMPSLFATSVYVSISSFDTATMQGIFSFLDTQVALYHYLISRVRAGNCAPDNNLLERATTTAL